jgi:hypothetical protein
LLQIAWLALASLLYFAFIVWWDATGSQWFALLDIFIIAIAAVIWGAQVRQNRSLVVPIAAAAAIVATANFAGAIWPRHTLPNPRMQTAECFTESTDAADTYIPTDWAWFGYATYFYGYQGRQLTLLRGEAYRDRNLEYIRETVAETQLRGGEIYVVDLGSYSAEEVDRTRSDLGLYLRDLSVCEHRPAFTCGGLQFMMILHCE